MAEIQGRRVVVITVIALVFALLFSATMAYAQGPGACVGSIIPCGCDGPDAGSVVDPAEQCTFNDLIILAQNFINFLIFKIASPLAAVMFAYAGFLYLTNAGNESKVKQAHDIFTAVFIGLVVALGAWLLIYFIVNFFLDPSYVYLAPP